MALPRCDLVDGRLIIHMLSRHAQRVYGASQRRRRKATRTSANTDCGSDRADDGDSVSLPNSGETQCGQAGKVARNREYEEALRRRDFRVVLWMIANGDVPAHYETVGGDTALLAAIAAKDTEAVRRIVAGYVGWSFVDCFGATHCCVLCSTAVCPSISLTSTAIHR